MSALHLLPTLLEELESIFDEIAQISHGLMLSNIFINRQIKQLTPADARLLDLIYMDSLNVNRFAREHKAKTSKLAISPILLAREEEERAEEAARVYQERARVEAARAVRVALADRSPAARRQLSYWVLSLPE